MREGPTNRYEQFDAKISDFVTHYEEVLKTSSGKLEKGDIEVINNKIVELDTKRDQNVSKEVRAYIDNCMERLAAIVLSQMPERAKDVEPSVQVANDSIRYDKAA